MEQIRMRVGVAAQLDLTWQHSRQKHNLGCRTLWELKIPQEHGELGRDELMSMASDKLTTAGPHMQGFEDAGTLDAVSGSTGPAERSGVHDKVAVEPEVR
jgi:hypothetical protein